LAPASRPCHQAGFFQRHEDQIPALANLPLGAGAQADDDPLPREFPALIERDAMRPASAGLAAARFGSESLRACLKNGRDAFPTRPRDRKENEKPACGRFIRASIARTFRKKVPALI
jgi:hypothetical protein